MLRARCAGVSVDMGCMRVLTFERSVYKVAGHGSRKFLGSVALPKVRLSLIARLFAGTALPFGVVLLSSGATFAACTGGPAITCTDTTTYSDTETLGAGITSLNVANGATVNYNGSTTIAWLPWALRTTGTTAVVINGTVNMPNGGFASLGTGTVTVGSTGAIIGGPPNAIEVHGRFVVESGGRVENLLGPHGTHLNLVGDGNSASISGTLYGNQTAIFLSGSGQSVDLNGAALRSRSAAFISTDRSRNVVTIANSSLGNNLGAGMDYQEPAQGLIRLI